MGCVTPLMSWLPSQWVTGSQAGLQEGQEPELGHHPVHDSSATTLLMTAASLGDLPCPVCCVPCPVCCALCPNCHHFPGKDVAQGSEIKAG